MYSHNTERRIPYRKRYLKNCGICRTDHIDIIINKTVKEKVNKSLSGIYRYGEKFSYDDHGIYNCEKPIDLYFKKYKNFSHNLFNKTSCRKYIMERYHYLDFKQNIRNNFRNRKLKKVLKKKFFNILKNILQ